MANRGPYEIETPRRPPDDASAAKRSRQARRRLLGLGGKGRFRRSVREPMSLPRNAQRSTVKVSFAPNRSSGQWRAHGRYIGRESSRPDPEKRGLGFDAARDDVDVSARLGGWERAGDPVLWKMVLSPENGAKMDLRQHARELVGHLERDLGTRLEWVAVEHDHNAHPHLHVAIRGVRDDGARLGIPPQYLKHGIRARSSELATRELGPRTRRDHLNAREAAIDARHVGVLDYEIERRAKDGRALDFRREPPPGTRERQVWRRLEVLEQMGLAKRAGRRWQIAEDLKPALRTVQRTRDLQRSLRDPAIALSERGPRVRWTTLADGEEVTGRFAGAVLDEASDRTHVLVEGSDGWLHVIAQTPRLERERAEGWLRNGGVVTLQGRAFEREDGARVPWVEPRSHGTLETLRAERRPTTLLDRDALRFVREEGTLPSVAGGDSGFARAWREAVRERRELLVRAGLLIEEVREEGRAHTLSRTAEAWMDDRGRDRSPMNLEELRASAEKPLRDASDTAGQRLRGSLHAIVYDRDGARYAVLDTGRQLTAIPDQASELEVGHQYEARSEAQRQGDRRRTVAWQLDDLERLRGLERDAGR